MSSQIDQRTGQTPLTEAVLSTSTTTHTGLCMQLRCACVRKIFSKEGIHKKCDHLNHQLISDILNDDDVLFHWSIHAINLDNEEADALLPLIAEQ